MPEIDLKKWGNANQVLEQFGLSRSTLYKLAEAGRIKSVSIKTHPGARKGARLFSLESISKLLEESSLILTAADSGRDLGKGAGVR